MRRNRTGDRDWLTPLLAALGLILLPVALLACTGQAAADGPVVVAIDGDTTGNSARTVDKVDDCVSVPVGARFDVDVVVPAPGIPAQGISGYQLQFYYDLRVISVQDADDDMLLAQAPGSNLVPFSDSTPSRTGEYTRVTVDFGPAGIEPEGASETGPGVILRLTLRAEGEGKSPLGLRDVRLVDDSSAIYGNVKVLTGMVYVGSACPVAAANISPSPTSSPTPLMTLAPAATARTTPTSAPGGAGGVIPGGGPEAGVGVLSPEQVGRGLPAIGLGMAVLGIAGIAGGTWILAAPAGAPTRERFQKTAWTRAIWKRRGNKDC